jgi:starvation-inducible outer membrane lipoprotein
LTRHDAPQQDLVRVMNAPQLYVGQEARFGGKVVNVQNQHAFDGIRHRYAAAQRNGNRRGQQPANALFLTRHDVRVMNAPQLYVGQEARFGGKVVNVQNQQGKTRLEIATDPAAAWGWCL